MKSIVSKKISANVDHQVSSGLEYTEAMTSVAPGLGLGAPSKVSH